jgi:hypothetical protein
MQFHFAAIGAFKGRRQRAGKRQAAAFAKRRADEADLRPALRTDKTIARGGASGFTKLTDFGINQTKDGVKPVLTCNKRHMAKLFLPAVTERKFGEKVFGLS